MTATTIIPGTASLDDEQRAALLRLVQYNEWPVFAEWLLRTRTEIACDVLDKASSDAVDLSRAKATRELLMSLATLLESLKASLPKS